MTKQSMKRGMGSPSNVEVPLSTEEAHVHLHLGVQVAHAHLNILESFTLKLIKFLICS